VTRVVVRRRTTRSPSLGARCPARGTYVLEVELGDFPTRAATIAAGIL
jgi:hypothetical protein